MPEVQVRNRSGEVVDTVLLPEETFGGEVKEHLVHEVVVMQLAKRRSGTASTKNKGAVKASTIKPWRQKGTGRARVGSRKSPLWRGGGTIFGPSPRDYGYKVPKKVRKQALRSAIADKLRNDQVVIVDSLRVEEPKTKPFVALMQNLGIRGSALVLLDEDDRNLCLSVRNIPGVKTLQLRGLNVYDLLYYEKVLLCKDIIPRLEEVLS